MKKSNKNKIEIAIETLESKIAPLQKLIYEITEKEELEVQLPRCRKMVGWCLKSTYDDYTYAKILEFIEPKNKYFTFLMEYIYVNKEGIACIQLSEQYPYLNKEWWDSEVPMSGWERISDMEYETAKAKVWEEMNTRKTLRKHISKY